VRCLDCDTLWFKFCPQRLYGESWSCCGKHAHQNTYVWNLVTSCFYEKYLAKTAVDLTLLLLLTKSLPIPSIEQFGLYFLFSILACTIGTSTYCFFAFFTMARESSLINPIYGFSGVLMAISMFARHTYRDETVHSAFPKLTYHHLPVVLYLIQLTLYLVFGRTIIADMPFSAISLLFSWSYLRFYYKHSNSEVLGDKSEDFSFVGMFPEVRALCFMSCQGSLFSLLTTHFFLCKRVILTVPPLISIVRHYTLC